MGALANEVRGAIEEKMALRRDAIAAAELEAKLARETLDVTLPGTRREVGHKHPMTSLLDEVKDIFIGMGFEIVDGPEVETSFYNFTALNTPESHPSREMHMLFADMLFAMVMGEDSTAASAGDGMYRG